jgi:hypothetical protein
MSLITKEVRENGIYKEVYVYFMGACIYKIWFIKGKRIAGKIFHDGEGLTQFRRKKQ